jgi:hypothetical protein
MILSCEVFVGVRRADGDGVRAVITNKSSSTWMSLSEFEVYGPDLAVTPTR